MPKAAIRNKSGPVTPRARGRPKKAQISSPLIDDQAAESDDGVVVDNPKMDPNFDEDELFEDLNTYEEDFINDGDPEEDKESSSGYITPPPPVVKKSPSKSASRFKPKVIEIESTSEEDMEALDVDDRKPANVKPTALPPGLTTRSAAKREPSRDTADHPTRKKPKSVATTSPQSAGPQFVMTEDLNNVLHAWMTNFMANVAPQPVASPSSSSPSPARPKRIHFDQLELDKAIEISKNDTGSSLATARATSTNKGKGKGKAKAVIPDRASSTESLPASIPLPPKTPESSGRKVKSQRSLVKDIISRMGGDMDAGSRKEFSNTSTPPISKYMKPPVKRIAKPESAPTGETPRGSEKQKTLKDDEPRSTTFLEDLETYKTYYDENAPCGVFDPDLQDPALAPYYEGDPPLPGGRQVLPVFDRNRLNGVEADAGLKGGRVKFGSWKKHARSMLAENSIGAMLFVEAAPRFINPSKVSPIRLSSQISGVGSSSIRFLQHRVRPYRSRQIGRQLGEDPQMAFWCFP
ncbi:hypothetical protein C8J57DRAFT_1473161 [Mycena rebaudengoi]|nr:hypothetical protein C8J57DRAFT_1473161 [Mycena rebaudengoi]